ncbi:MAG: alpha/beta fold hydrolase [Vicinamibacterales bacterium]|jgi:hypothetical protein|nr:hypothetical protein [Acidobacteriota bacterium]MDP7471227.1 alpha/beta fold hydrolase [Vicinamibacterales bacterium]MDP7672636.1 alpha/beta fold hydrolase [Vicinamibacterales bacterium]HJO36980.1 alpha/beta fold hydrolase [Vicinamibacterales bacterium]|tara:strand:- start:7333 stop:9012 length:1680 start_codon:yes stop_codon:yes gene_type:complete
MRAPVHCTVALLATTLYSLAAAAQDNLRPTPGQSTFSIFVQLSLVGTEEISVDEVDGGWTISSTGRVSGPLDLAIRRFEMRYNDAWQPQALSIDAVLAGQPYEVETTFTDTSAASEILEAGEARTKSDPISAGVVVLPTNFFASYEALATRLSAASPGAAIPAYIAPQAEIVVRLNTTTEQRIATADGTIEAHRHHVTFLNRSNPFDAEIWSDAGRRLVRISMPTIGLDIARQDIVSLSTRQQTVRNPRDEDEHIAASGFNLAATITVPAPVAETDDDREWPAVILVPGSGSTDRDETHSGVPVYGQLAGGLSDAGFFVVRYDKRGIGQSGGRIESATLSEYAEDVRSVVRYLRDRDDVDDRRIAVVGHDESGWIAMLAAKEERRIAALGLLATPSTRGAEFVIEQQAQTLAQLNLPEEERVEKIDLQQRIHAAVMRGGGWEGIPLTVRAQAETPWFRSYLEFWPADVIQDLRQPMIVVHGGLDRQIVPGHADRLAEMGQARDRQVVTELLRFDTLNHLLIPAVTGEVDEYDTLEDKTVSEELIGAMAGRLHEMMPPRR